MVYYVDHPTQLFNLRDDPNETNDLAAHPDGNLATQAALIEGERRLREICNPERVPVANLRTDKNSECFADQKRRIQELGGREACINAYRFNHTPTPDEQKKNCRGTN